MSVLFLSKSPVPVLKKIKSETVALVVLRIPRIPTDHPKAVSISKSILKTIHACKRTMQHSGIVAILSFQEQDSMIDYLKAHKKQFFRKHVTWAKGSDGSRLNLFSEMPIAKNVSFVPNGGVKRDCARYLKTTERDIPVIRYSFTESFHLHSHINLLKRIILTYGRHGAVLMPFFDSWCGGAVRSILWDHTHGIRFPGFQVAGITNNQKIMELVRNSMEDFRLVGSKRHN